VRSFYAKYSGTSLIADTSLLTPIFTPNLVISIQFDLCNQDTSQPRTAFFSLQGVLNREDCTQENSTKLLIIFSQNRGHRGPQDSQIFLRFHAENTSENCWNLASNSMWTTQASPSFAIFSTESRVRPYQFPAYWYV
jgi:hypothetical protein